MSKLDKAWHIIAMVVVLAALNVIMTKAPPGFSHHDQTMAAASTFTEVIVNSASVAPQFTDFTAANTDLVFGENNARKHSANTRAPGAIEANGHRYLYTIDSHSARPTTGIRGTPAMEPERLIIGKNRRI